MPENPQETTNKEYERLGLRDFFDVSKWVFKTIFSINPFYASVGFIFSIIGNVEGLINTYILAKIIDKIIYLASTEGSQVQDIYPF